MSEPVVKHRPTIDLDDLERHMRQQPAREDDPLAELARLVGEPYDPFNDVFEREAAVRPGQPASYQPASHQPAYQPSDPRHDGRREPGFAAPPRQGAPSRPVADFAAIEAGLRGTIQPGAAPQPHPPGFDPGYGHDGHGQHDGFHDAAAYADGSQGYGEEWAAHAGPGPQAKASRRPMHVMAATIAIGVIGIGAAFALKGRVSSSPREVRTIMAEGGPTKIQPPPDVADAGGPDASTGRNGQTPTTLVNREEQPVDIAQAVQDNAARVAGMKAGAGPSRVTDASSVPVPPSPRQVQTAMADPKAGRDVLGEQIQGFGLSDMPAPKRVKVVSVRPDGTILPNDQPPAAAMPASRQPQVKAADHAAPVAKASTPKVAAAKSTTRVATTPKSIEQLAADDAPEDAKPAKKPKPQRVATAEPDDGKEVSAPAGSGGFAVQLAAPATEAEAKAASSRFAKKFAGALGDRELGFRKAEANGKPVYRVRVGSLSRADAVSLCEKLKADGGTCFVAKN